MKEKSYTVFMEIRAFTPQDFAEIYHFMYPLWQETYGDILPKSQIDFLVEKFFSEQGLQTYRALGYEYYKLGKNGVLVFVEREEDVYMDKLYLQPCARGKGYPAAAFAFMSERGKPLRLSANQANARALRCYQKNGFTIEKSIDVELGNGMVNHDYILFRPARTVHK